MKKLIALILSVLMISVLLSACSDSEGEGSTTNPAADSQIIEPQNGGDAADSNNNGNGSEGNSPASGDAQGQPQGGDANSQPTGFVDASVAMAAFAKPAADGVQNNVADPSGDNLRFVYDETGRIVKCYYYSNNQEVYLNYTYNDMGWVKIYGFIGETLVANETVNLNGDYNPDVGYSVCNGYYFKGYVF